MAMRTGKTKVTLDWFGELVDTGQCDDLVVIAPGGVYRTWVTAIDDHVPDGFLNYHVWSGGKTVTERSNLERFLANRTKPRALLINVEALSSVDRARELIKQFLTQRRTLCAVDESTVIKNDSSERTAFIVEELAPLAKFRLILSGLVAPKSPLDLYTQYEYLSSRILGTRTFTAFRARFAIIKPIEVNRVRGDGSKGKRKLLHVVAYRDPDELHARIAPHSFRVRLEDCVDLPPKIYTFRDVDMTPEQVRIYRELKLFATASLDGLSNVTVSNVITQMLRLQQVLLGHTVDENGVEHTIPENRTKELINFIDELEDDQKVIIWASYDPDIRKISAALINEYGPQSVARFWGGNVKTREDEEKQFKTLPQCRFMVATQSAGGRGRTWDVAQTVAYFSSTNNLEHRMQSEERPLSISNPNRSILYADFRCPGTVETKIIEALRKKLDLATLINGDDYQQWLI